MKVRQRVGALLVATALMVGGAVALSSPAQAADYGPYRIVHTMTGWCMEVPHGSMVMGEQLRLGVCGPVPTWYQLFWFTDAGPNWNYNIRPGHNLWCITPGVVNLYHSSIVQWGCGAPNEVFFLGSSVDPFGHYVLDIQAQPGYTMQVAWDDLQLGGLVIQGPPTPNNSPHYDYWDLVHV